MTLFETRYKKWYKEILLWCNDFVIIDQGLARCRITNRYCSFENCVKRIENGRP